MEETRLYKLFKIGLNIQLLPVNIESMIKYSSGRASLVRYLRMLLDSDTNNFHIIDVDFDFELDVKCTLSITILTKEEGHLIYIALGELIKTIEPLDLEPVLLATVKEGAEGLFSEDIVTHGSLLEEKPEWGSLDGYVPADPIEEIQPSCMAENKEN